jgi:class 3 adenylate cyclase
VRSWPTSPTAALRWCSVTAERWISSPGTASWRCLVRRWLWRTTPFEPAWPAVGVQEEAKRLAAEVQDRDGLDLRLRVGLNSGQVIAGEVGSGALGYTAIGEQVGMAQRMESVAPPDGVMLGESTARLVRDVAVLPDAQRVHIKGATDPAAAFRLLRLDFIMTWCLLGQPG